jgi:hypothetical protein
MSRSTRRSFIQQSAPSELVWALPQGWAAESESRSMTLLIIELCPQSADNGQASRFTSRL